VSIYEDFDKSKAIANYLAASDLIPSHFQKKPSNVLIALEFAHRNNIAPFAAMQSMFVVHGRVGMSASMAISLARKHNVWRSLKYVCKGEGNSLSVTAIATLHDGTEVDTTVSYAMADAAGWTKNAMYKSIPEQMLKYRAAIFLIRSNFPEILFGLQTTEEIQDIYESKRVTPEDRKQAIEAEVVTQNVEVVTQTKEPVVTVENVVTMEQMTEHRTELPKVIAEVIEQSLEDEVFERDIEDMRGELLEYIYTAGPQVFVKLGKSKEFMIDKIEKTNTLSSMKTIYAVVKAT
jgi:hypothetical protein